MFFFHMCNLFFVIRIIAFLSCLNPSSKFKRGQGQTSVILLVKKLYLKSSLINSLVTNLDNFTPLDNFFMDANLLIMTAIMRNKINQT